MTQGAGRAVRECGCPPWVVRCAHLDGEALWQIDSHLFAHDCFGSNHQRQNRFAIVLRSETASCELTGEPFTHPRKDVWVSGQWRRGTRLHNRKPAADRAFYEAEERLLAANE